MTIAADTSTDWTESRSSTRARDLSIDTMRGMAILMVIGIHSLPQHVSSSWPTVIDATLRPCVPIFLFCSGVMSAAKHQIPLLRRLKAALIPYAIAFVAAYLYMALHNAHMDHRPVVTLARFGLAYVFVYYYVFAYVGCMICLWLLFKLAGSQDNDRKTLIALLVTAIAFGLLVGTYIDPLMNREGLSAALIEEVRMRDIPFWFTFVAAGMLTGILVNRSTLSGLSGLLLITTVSSYVVYVAVRLWQIGDAADYDSMAFFSYAASMALLLFAMRPSFPFLARLGSGSYFIYLWHIFIVMMLRDHAALDRFHPLVEFAVTFGVTAVTIIVSLIAVRRFAPPRLVHWLGA